MEFATFNMPKVDRPPEPTPPLIADRRLYLAADEKTLVEESDEAAAWLLRAKGQAVPGVDVDRLSLVMEDGRVVQLFPGQPVAVEAVDPSAPPAPPVINPSRSDDDLMSQFFSEAVDAGYTEEVSTSIAEGRLRDLRAGGTGYQNRPAEPPPAVPPAGDGEQKTDETEKERTPGEDKMREPGENKGARKR